MKTGIHLDYPEREYHQQPGLSSTGAKKLLVSPAKYMRDKLEPMEPTPAMRLGTCIHTAVLGTGQQFIAVEGSRNAKAVKEEIAEHEAKGLIVLTPHERDKVLAIAQSVRSTTKAQEAFARGQAEVSLCWEDQETGVTCRGRIDWLNPQALFDLKSTKDASKDGFPKQAANMFYDLQAAAYMDGHRTLTGEEIPFGFIAVETEAPYHCVVHQLPDVAIERGQALWAKAKRIYADCLNTGVWGGGENYPDNEIVTGMWPGWAV